MAKKILIIDDDAELCEEMAEFLNDEGYSVQTALDGNQGEKLIRKNNYDVILLDFKMPGLNGIDMLKIVKEKKPKPAVFIISGRPFIEKLLEEEKLTSVVDGIMGKPFDLEMMLKRIRSL
ncbi:MAG: hypothetical protein A2149_05135 [Candidatus Schekmanbacteria bacterium RBG_16_38_11]|uniref:Response regulatory domain-containing protein n=3 Tax=Bacteria candidate phyla TaxID=1783234 RepID=A0A1F7RKW9_9BACT|nr:MAG: Response regulator receiver domain protein [Candidatus Gottesmanbacteria bacterium GW2011_GWC2_39_8]OGL41614.1 MAG: hypothetical protein A2042_05070 [Candidatus Schekmanbacteria bacterium GWA2_38_11]OGL46852.1 MAG: hypothetical protein A2149_05135 [Candidatus Schekmanbacteria bacterium RBG_16_38_11]